MATLIFDLQLFDDEEVALNITNSTASSLITGTSLNDTIENTADKVTIDAGAGDDSIENSGSNVSINAGAGDDTISGVNSTTYIQAEVKSSEISGNDVILTTDNGTLTLTDARQKYFV